MNEIQDKFFDIPFGHSSYQNKKFVINAQQTPARAYRTIGMAMNEKLGAINHLKFEKQKADIEVRELQDKIDNPEKYELTTFDIERSIVESEYKQSGFKHSKKLLNDAIVELNFLYSELQKFPEYTREQFEEEEGAYYKYKLGLSLETENNGEKMSLAFMDDTVMNKNLIEANNAIGLDNK